MFLYACQGMSQSSMLTSYNLLSCFIYVFFMPASLELKLLPTSLLVFNSLSTFSSPVPAPPASPAWAGTGVTRAEIECH